MQLSSHHGRALIGHWMDIAGERLMPARTDLDPGATKSTLPYILMHEHVRPDLIRFRLYGTGLHTIYQRDLTGLNYLDFVKDGGRATTIARLNVMIEQPCGLRTTIVAPSGHDLNVLYELVGLPLADAAGEARYMIYTADPIERGVPEAKARRMYLNAQVPDYIDIGAGIPAIPDPVL